MKTIYHLAISRLKYNKGRSILTIVAIALMTTLLMSIGTDSHWNHWLHQPYQYNDYEYFSSQKGIGNFASNRFV